MNATLENISLANRLPQVRGRYSFNAPLAPQTWFRVGGPAEALFKPADAADLQHFLKNCPADIAITPIGVASNLLVRDGGVEGVVIRLGAGFAAIDVHGNEISVGAGALDSNVAMTALEYGLAGLEFLSGSPGTIGGALRMNAGAYGHEVKDILVSATAFDRQGNLHSFSAKEMGFSYRHCSVPDDYIFVSATFAGIPQEASEIAARMAEIKMRREATQPIHTRTSGSTFANPPGQSAWKLIDEVGGRGLKMGGAMISELHTNFLLNTGDATAADIENLGEEIRRRVKDQKGVDLRWEIQRIGKTKEQA